MGEETYEFDISLLVLLCPPVGERLDQVDDNLGTFHEFQLREKFVSEFVRITLLIVMVMILVLQRCEFLANEIPDTVVAGRRVEFLKALPRTFNTADTLDRNLFQVRKHVKIETMGVRIEGFAHRVNVLDFGEEAFVVGMCGTSE